MRIAVISTCKQDFNRFVMTNMVQDETLWDVDNINKTITVGSVIYQMVTSDTHSCGMKLNGYLVTNAWFDTDLRDRLMWSVYLKMNNQ